MHDEWLARWRDGRIGFHEGQPNVFLDRYLARLAGARRVFVPLCGRSEDLALLAAHGHEVVGVELSEQAVREFFELHALVPAVTSHGPFVAYRAGSITLLVGDLFDTTPALVGATDALYDRAALIALPAELRARYVAHVRALLPAGAPGLVITLEFDAALMSGPPFPVVEDELRALYAGATVEWLEDGAAPGGKCAQTKTPATERCFAIRLVEPRL
ncbi:MAG: thiopurine S-methyltransferase [Kofleriaceae bacterium]